MNEPHGASIRPAPIGYYVHHHGRGHVARYEKISAASDVPITPISELDLVGGVHLQHDVVTDGVDPTAGGGLHWAPIGDRQSARRARTFGSWLDQAQPAGVVVDVSVEATLLCRLFGVRTVVVRQHGDRTDPVHELGYRSAAALLAPFPEPLEHRSTPDWIRDKTVYAGFVAEGGGPRMSFHGLAPPPRPKPDDLVILWGTGGGTLQPAHAAELVELMHPHAVWFAGDADAEIRRTGVHLLGWIDDVSALLSNRPTVLGSAGNNVVADAAAAGCALIVAPQDRPFDEQIRHAQSLVDAGAASMVCGDRPDWRVALAEARRRRPVLHALARHDGAAVAAEAILDAFRAGTHGGRHRRA